MRAASQKKKEENKEEKKRSRIHFVPSPEKKEELGSFNTMDSFSRTLSLRTH